MGGCEAIRHGDGELPQRPPPVTKRSGGRCGDCKTHTEKRRKDMASGYFKEKAERQQKIWTRVQQQLENLKARACGSKFESKFQGNTKLLFSMFDAKDPAELATALYKYFEEVEGFDDYYDTGEFGSYAESVSYDIENYFTNEDYDIENYFTDEDDKDVEEPAYGLAIITNEDWNGLGLGDLIEGGFPDSWFD
jgi:hypothetical protein